MIREKEIFNDLSNICEEGRKGILWRGYWIIRLSLIFGLLEVWKVLVIHGNCASPTNSHSLPAQHKNMNGQNCIGRGLERVVWSQGNVHFGIMI